MAHSDLEAIRHALTTARRHGFATVRIEQDDWKFEATLAPEEGDEFEIDLAEATSPAADSPAAVLFIVSPVVGYFRERDPAVVAGQEVSAGEIVGSVEALGIANDVVAPITGVIEEVLVPAGAAVHFGQPIAAIREVTS